MKGHNAYEVAHVRSTTCAPRACGGAPREPALLPRTSVASRLGRRQTCDISFIMIILGSGCTPQRDLAFTVRYSLKGVRQNGTLKTLQGEGWRKHCDDELTRCTRAKKNGSCTTMPNIGKPRRRRTARRQRNLISTREEQSSSYFPCFTRK